MRAKDPDPGDPSELREDGEGEDDMVIFAAEAAEAAEDATVANAPQTPRPILAAVDDEDEDEEGEEDEDEDEEDEVVVDEDEDEEEEDEDSFESLVREIEMRWRTKARR